MNEGDGEADSPSPFFRLAAFTGLCYRPVAQECLGTVRMTSRTTE